MTILAFIHIEKCGGSTIVDLLRETYGWNHFDVIPRSKLAMSASRDDLLLAYRLAPRLSSLAGHCLRPTALREAPLPLAAYTLLREPRARYVSDFIHHVDLKGFPNDFSAWLQYKDRWNYQVRALAGNGGGVTEAVSALERLALVGFVERFDQFIGSLSELSQGRLPLAYAVRNSSRARQGTTDARPLLEAHASAIEHANEEDDALYSIAWERWGSLAPSRIGHAIIGDRSRRSFEMHGRSLALKNRLYRNLVYKPAVARLPARYHSLPAYARRWGRQL